MFYFVRIKHFRYMLIILMLTTEKRNKEIKIPDKKNHIFIYFFFFLYIHIVFYSYISLLSTNLMYLNILKCSLNICTHHIYYIYIYITYTFILDVEHVFNLSNSIFHFSFFWFQNTNFFIFMLCVYIIIQREFSLIFF